MIVQTCTADEASARAAGAGRRGTATRSRRRPPDGVSRRSPDDLHPVEASATELAHVRGVDVLDARLIAGWLKDERPEQPTVSAVARAQVVATAHDLHLCRPGRQLGVPGGHELTGGSELARSQTPDPLS